MKKISLEDATAKLLEGKSLKTESGSFAYEDYIGVKNSDGDWITIIFFDHAITYGESDEIGKLLQRIKDGEVDYDIEDFEDAIKENIDGVVGSINLDESDIFYLD